MASDTDASRRKHRRSPNDEEVEKSSKRHKHRHHHRHHRHRSKKHGEETKQGADGFDYPPAPPPSAIPHGCDDDLEEGEILEEEGGSAKDVQIRDGITVSQNLGVQADKRDNGFVTNSDIGEKLGNDATCRADPEVLANGDMSHEYLKEDKRQHGNSMLHSRGSQKQITSHDVYLVDADQCKLSGCSKLSSESDRDKRNVVPSPSYDKYDEAVHPRGKSMSRDVTRDRSRSRSVVEEEAKIRRHSERLGNNSDVERMTHHTDLHHGSKDLVRDVEREHSISYSRYFEGEDRHHSLDSRDQERSRERERDSNRRRNKEREGSREVVTESDRRREREWEGNRDRERWRESEQERSRDSEMDRDWRREKDRGKSKDRDRRREKHRDTSRDREVDRERPREERERSWNMELDRDRRKEKENGRIRDREVDTEWRREKELERSKEREREFDKYRQKERDRTSERDRDREREKDKVSDRYRDRDRFRDHDYDKESDRERERRGGRTIDKARDRKSDAEKVRDSNNSSSRGRDKQSRDEDEQDDFEEKITFKLAEQEEEELNKIKEESRKRRQAILEKYSKKQLEQQNESHSEDVKKGEEPVKHPAHAVDDANVASESPDVRIDGQDAPAAEPSFSLGKSPPLNGLHAQRIPGAAGLGEGTPKSERSDEKFCDDIFGETPTGVRKAGKEDGLPIVRGGFNDNWDDAEGYYSYRFGELLDGRYEVAAAHGKGVFSTVVRAKDLKAGIGDPVEVAIKIIRNNETMNKAGKEEVQILKKLAASDPENKRHCVRFLSSFKYRNHLCLVFESLHMNLREVLKKFGRNIGLKLTAIRAYAKQLFIALKHLKNCGVLHCDIKPDNMLVNEAKNVLKLCDFGNAMSSGKNEITPYLVSRFYRAPEIILGLAYDHPMDMWSVGCCLYELYTGKVLFPGPTNNDMLRLHMELKGHFPKKMLKKGAFVDQHFDQDLNFLATEEDPVTKKIVKRMIVNIKPKDIGSIIAGSPGEDPKMLANFKDLLDKIFMLDPEKRLTVSQALAHPFITGK